MATQLNVKCIDQTLTLVNAPKVASGGRNEDTITFTFCSKWNNYTARTCIFYKNENSVYYSVLDNDNICIIPHEVLKEEGVIFFGVFATYGTSTRTSEVMAYKVVKGAITENLQPIDPTQSMYEQFLAKATEIATLYNGKVNISDIIDNLTSTDTNKPLSANQGRALKALIDAIDTSSYVQVADIVNNLTSTDTNKPLSANQGKVLKDLIDDLPASMQFKGSVGTNGTIEWANLPAASSANEGYVYKAITDHATAPICEDGDTIISNATEWVVIPSGNEPSGTITSISCGTGLTGGVITESGTIAIDSNYFGTLAFLSYTQVGSW